MAGREARQLGRRAPRPHARPLARSGEGGERIRSNRLPDRLDGHLREYRGLKLPDDAAEDSFDLLPIFLGQADKPVREFTLHQTISLALAIRHGDWKYLDHKGSGGSNYSRDGEWGLKQYALSEKAPEAPGQLYNLKNDPGETDNLYFKKTDVRKELKAKLEELKKSGRSAPKR